MHLAVVGATGNLGKAVIAAALKDKRFLLTSALAHKDSNFLGQDIGHFHFKNPNGISIETLPSKPIDIVIDFSCEEGTLFALSLGVPLVIGTTGLSDQILAAIKEQSKKIPIVLSPNFSLGMKALFALLPTLEKSLDSQFTTHISETHREDKRDKPSGTAKRLASLIPGETPITSKRVEDCNGEHEVTFVLDGEMLSLNHVAMNRTPYARGALEAAAFVCCHPPGLYSFSKVFEGV